MKEILISSHFGQTQVAFLENKVLVDFFVQNQQPEIQVGNIYKGIVESIIPGMDAAFINIGLEKRGFIHVDDIVNGGLEYEDLLEKPAAPKEPVERNIRKLLKEGQELMVQVVKEPIGTKGARLTTHVALPGRYMVYMPMERRLGISKKIKDGQERDRLKTIIKALRMPQNAGLIVRTAGVHKERKDFDKELYYLMTLWKKVIARQTDTKAPAIVHREELLEICIVRDFFYEDVGKVVIESKEVYKNSMQYVKLLMPSMAKKVEYYEDKVSLFEKWAIEGEIAKIHDRYVYLRSGGYLIIEQLESLVAIDVNTGKYTGKKNLEDTVLKVNLEAAKEIARQVRLRDLGGIIIVDFIDMESMDLRKKVLQTLHDAMQTDKAKFDVLGMSELCLVEMTRQRVRKSLERQMYQNCPYCKGRGSVKNTSSLALETLKKIKSIWNKSHPRFIEVGVHPEVASCLLNEERTHLVSLEKELDIKIAIRPEVTAKWEEIKIN